MKKYFHHAGYTPRMVTPDYMYNVYDRTGEMIDIPQIECISPIGKLVQPKTIAEQDLSKRCSLIRCTPNATPGNIILFTENNW